MILELLRDSDECFEAPLYSVVLLLVEGYVRPSHW